MAELTIRLVFSLAVVLGLLLLCARLAGRRFQGRNDALVQVVHRQHISRNASVSVVNVAGRVLVLGSTDQEVRLLAELDPSEVDGATDRETDGATDRETDPETARETRGDLAALTLVTSIDPAADVLLREEDDREQPVGSAGRHLAPRGARSAGARSAGARSAGARSAGGSGSRAGGQQGALGGSVLSVRTWRQAWGAVTGRAS